LVITPPADAPRHEPIYKGAGLHEHQEVAAAFNGYEPFAGAQIESTNARARLPAW
jgi:hypothetical protein